MRANRAVGGLIVLLVAGLALNCVGDSTTAGQDAAADVDLTGTESHPCFANGTCDQGLECISQVCVNLDGGSDGATDSAINDASDAGADVAFDFACSAPCSGGKVCCGTIDTTGSFPGCSVTTASSVCALGSACTSSILTLSCGVNAVRFCTQAADCTESGDGSAETSYDHCCTLNGFKPPSDAGFPTHACMSQTFASGSGATCVTGGD